MKLLKYLLGFITLLIFLVWIAISCYDGPAIELNTAGQFEYASLNCRWVANYIENGCYADPLGI